MFVFVLFVVPELLRSSIVANYDCCVPVLIKKSPLLVTFELCDV